MRRLTWLGVFLLFTWIGFEHPVFAASPTQEPVPAWAEVDLGLPQGNAHQPVGLAVARRQGLAYVLSARTPERRAALSIVDLRRHRLVRRILLDPPGAAADVGNLLLHPNGVDAYFIDRAEQRLYLVNSRSGESRLLLDGVWQAYLDGERHTLLILGNEGLQARSLSDLQPVWTLPLQESAEIRVGIDSFLVETRPDFETRLHRYALGDGSLQADTTIEDWVDDFVAGPLDSWFVMVNRQEPTIVELNDELSVVNERVHPSGARLIFDPYSQHLIVNSIQLDESTGRVRALTTRMTADLSTVGVQEWRPDRGPNLFARSAGLLVAVERYGDSDALFLIHPETLQILGQVPLGVRIEALALEPGGEHLWVADNQERIRRVEIESGEVTGDWFGSVPFAMNKKRDRLYLSRFNPQQGMRIQTIEASTGDLVATFPQPGWPAIDEDSDVVYITHGGITAYDETGLLLGRLDSTFPDPQGTLPNPAAYRAFVNPVSHNLIVFKTNGVPGSNRRNFATVYRKEKGERLPIDEPISIPLLDHVRTTIAFDRISGDFFLANESFRGISGLQRLQADGRVVEQVYGQGGQLFFDPLERRLFVQNESQLSLFSENLTLIETLHLPEEIGELVWDSVGRRFFYTRPGEASLFHFTLADLQPSDMSTLNDREPGRPVQAWWILTGPDDGKHHFVLVDGLFRSEDNGANWSQVDLVADEIEDLWLTSSDEGVIVAALSGRAGGHGIMISEDGGQNWIRMNQGLTDLRAHGPVPILSSGNLILIQPSNQMQIGSIESAEWRSLALPDAHYISRDGLRTGPDDTLYLLGVPIRVSHDLGKSWTSLPPPEEPILEFVAGYEEEHLYSLQGYGPTELVHSVDGGISWHSLDPPLVLPDELLAQRRLIRDARHLYVAERREGLYTALYRITDDGESWKQLSNPDVLSGVEHLAPGGAEGLWRLRGGQGTQIELIPPGVETFLWASPHQR